MAEIPENWQRRYRRFIHKTFLTAAAMVMLGGCHLFRKAPPAPEVSTEAFSPRMLENMSQPRGWYAIRGLMKYSGDQKVASPFSMRMKADSVIWVSFTPALGLEALRARITRDKGEVLNRIERRYYVKQREELAAGMLPADLLDLQSFQYLLWGIPEVSSADAYEWTVTDTVIIGTREGATYSERLLVDPSVRRLRRRIIEYRPRRQTIVIDYGPYHHDAHAGDYPAWITINVYPQGHKTVKDSLLIRFKKLARADSLAVPMRIPPGYEQGP